MADKSQQTPGSKGKGVQPGQDAETEFQDGSDQSTRKPGQGPQSGAVSAEDVEEQGSVEDTLVKNER